MYPIEFRVWDLVTKEMLYENDIDNYIVNTGEDGYFHVLKVARFVPQQFTGLYDKNGKKIFIGDLVKFHDEVYGVIINNFSKIPVIDSDLGQEDLYKCFHEVEVIGNVYEGETV